MEGQPKESFPETVVGFPSPSLLSFTNITSTEISVSSRGCGQTDGQAFCDMDQLFQEERIVSMGRVVVTCMRGDGWGVWWWHA